MLSNVWNIYINVLALSSSSYTAFIYSSLQNDATIFIQKCSRVSIYTSH